MTSAALLVALLHVLTFRSPVQMEYDGDFMVRPVYEAAGIDGIAVVWMESKFDPNAEKVERDRAGRVIGTSFGLWELFDRYHPQFRGDVGKHIEYGAGFWAGCKARALGNFTLSVRLFNSGSRTRGIAWADPVKSKRDDLAHYLWIRLR